MPKSCEAWPSNTCGARRSRLGFACAGRYIRIQDSGGGRRKEWGNRGLIELSHGAAGGEGVRKFFADICERAGRVATMVG